MDLKVIGLDVDATISGWCSVECLCISNVEISGCATPVLVFSSRRKCHHNYQWKYPGFTMPCKSM